MGREHVRQFASYLRINSEIEDIRGQIAIALNMLGKLELQRPINRYNLESLIQATNKRPETTDPGRPVVDRYQRMLYQLTTQEFKKNLTPTDSESESLSDSGSMIIVPDVSVSGPIMIDPTIEIEDREEYFEIDNSGFGIYDDSSGPYETEIHSSLAAASELHDDLYLLYGTIIPNLDRFKRFLKAIHTNIGWMPDLKKFGWSGSLLHMSNNIQQRPMKFVGLITISGYRVTQVNGGNMLRGYSKDTPKLMDLNDGMIEKDKIIELMIGNLELSQGVCFEVPILNVVSPRISTVGLRCVSDTEIIGQAKFKMLSLDNSLIGRLHLPKLKTDVLYM